MEPRLDLAASPLAARSMKYFFSASNVIFKDSTLPKALQDLVMLRASQINGCGFCVDMHSKDLARAGESPVRVNMVAAWRESTMFTEAERAALELAEQGTRIADAAAGVTDEAWAKAAEQFDDEQLTALVLLISLINTANRLNVIVRQPGGGHQPGQLA
ncbi:carboxymuconolactone decarboxylase family protein [Nonomuraea diastatica]|uniref:Carboxymuconolactone decarboxylase family protein n=1 Tax=Nonomuraea diastatica TaxID=1848329 RepID=A0A4R4WRS1_9ACTN|nr:carboxymuconolactone decarboxylase family protein [Nonomuraea diastatica]TDD18920.1 carboxymuconolactone decarboxylase family protein [Nonomuraea diastatica]